MIENITIFTDASFCHETNAAAGACWSRSDNFKFNSVYPLVNVESSNEAEFEAALVGIQLTINSPEISELIKADKCRVILVTDCDSVAREIMGSPLTHPRAIQAVRMMNAAGVLYKVNHVKAHTSNKNARSWVNRWCDTNARSMMREIRTKLSGGA